MPDILEAKVVRITKPATKYCVTTLVHKLQDDVWVECPEEKQMRHEWRVEMIVNEEWVGDKPHTMCFSSEEAANKIKQGDLAYRF